MSIFLTRCPVCLTTFRMTPEQLVMRDGNVRCGSCHHVFNAMEHLLEEDGSPAGSLPPVPQRPAATSSRAGRDSASARAAAPSPSARSLPPTEASPSAASPSAVLPSAVLPSAGPIRDLREHPGYSRWSAAPLETMMRLREPRLVWPFALAAAICLVALATQTYMFRTPLSLKNHEFAMFFRDLGASLPPLREAEWITIEDSDLIAMTTPGRLHLSARLRNGAPYTQVWPYLELTLTDSYNVPVARKVLSPNEYLPEDAPAIFASGDQSVNLVLDVGRLPVAGYTLYRFYP
ncbi:MAG: zinc-ribbon and DUF3426 domain-containing protein [Zoogloeaceae bacterium]|jgi:predicted Zn finger-like uncharacterized protein|nr:zinc-ribbon and DUF3426 domain-containing protein [Zoogloeaceae bacterium]